MAAGGLLQTPLGDVAADAGIGRMPLKAPDGPAGATSAHNGTGSNNSANTLNRRPSESFSDFGTLDDCPLVSASPALMPSTGELLDAHSHNDMPSPIAPSTPSREHTACRNEPPTSPISSPNEQNNPQAHEYNSSDYELFGEQADTAGINTLSWMYSDDEDASYDALHAQQPQAVKQLRPSSSYVNTSVDTVGFHVGAAAPETVTSTEDNYLMDELSNADPIDRDDNDDDYSPEMDGVSDRHLGAGCSSSNATHQHHNDQMHSQHLQAYGVKRSSTGLMKSTPPRHDKFKTQAASSPSASAERDDSQSATADVRDNAVSHAPSSKEKFTRTYAEGVQHLIRRAKAPFVHTGQWKGVEVKVDAELSKFGLKKNNKGEYFRRIAAHLFGEGVLDRDGKWYALMKSPRARRRFLRILVWLLSDKQWEPTEAEIERLYSRQSGGRGDASSHFEWDTAYASTVPALAEKMEFPLPVRMPEPDDPSLPSSLRA